jgi:ankyrin repeat protein
VSKGDIKKVETILKSAPSLVNAKTDNGYTPLHTASQHDHRDIAELLIIKGADVNVKTDDGRTPLQTAKTE